MRTTAFEVQEIEDHVQLRVELRV
eukprot:SAG31_NODE_21091_length_558_cov_0.886710_2_plen_23_part_01